MSDTSSSTKDSIQMMFRCGHYRYIPESLVPTEGERQELRKWGVTIDCVDCVIKESSHVANSRGC